MDPDGIETVKAFYTERRQSLCTYALLHTGCAAEAEDVLHAVFDRLLRLDVLPEQLPAYVYRAIRNAAIDLHRRNGHAEAYKAIFLPRKSISPGDQLEARDEAEALLASLSIEERECVVMKVYADLTFDEIAAVCGGLPNTIASRYRRALAKMRDQAECES